MEDKKAGAALLKVMVDKASKSDVHTIVHKLHDEEEFRSRCNALRALVQDEAEERRAKLCRCLAVILVTEVDPKCSPEEVSIPTSPVFSVFCVPAPGNLWQDHMKVEYKPSGKIETTFVSKFLAERLLALEDLWGVPEHFISRGKIAAKATRG